MIPAGWVKVAVLRTSMVTCTSDKVFLYLSDPGLRQELLTLLHSFSAGLPAGSKIELIP